MSITKAFEDKRKAESKVEDARIEEIVSFPTLESLNHYVEDSDKEELLYDINFGFGSGVIKAQWNKTFSSTAVRYAKNSELLLHICMPYKDIKLDKNGMLCAGFEA